MNNRIYQLCQDVITNDGSITLGINCDDIDCAYCPFSRQNNEGIACDVREPNLNKKIAEYCLSMYNKPTDQVNSPSHYTQGNIEVIEVIEDWKLNYNLGNAIKYIGRCEHKGNKKQDLEKAIWYIKREIERCK